MNILVTGGTGYIGSHTVVELLKDGHEVIIVDNLINSSKNVLDRIYALTNIMPVFYDVDVCDYKELNNIFEKHDIDAVIHFAALKSPGVSVVDPLLYYQTNVNSTLNLAKVMDEHKVRKLVFSSSAAVYGTPKRVPIREDADAFNAANPYGQTKVICERIWQDIVRSNNSWDVTLLRYFNPVGAHPSGLIGEDPSGPPNNLVPYISQVAVGKRKELEIFGDDYDTVDGTGVRDYIHILDLVEGHIAALNKNNKAGTAPVYNLGTGNGYSVFEVLRAFELASGRKISYKVSPRRSGDIDTCFADCSKAAKDLKWKATRSLQEMCKDAWHWQVNNPDGYSVTKR